MIRFSSSLFRILLLLLLPFVTNATIGTVDGYDNGGSGSVCIYYAFSASLGIFNSGEDVGLIQQTDAEIYNSQKSITENSLTNNSQFFRQCPNGTEIAINITNVEEDPEIEDPVPSMFPGKPYGYRINLRIPNSPIQPIQPISSSSLRRIFLFRFVICDLLRAGWCNPILAPPIEPREAGEGIQGFDGALSGIVGVSNASSTLYGITDFQSGVVQTNWAAPIEYDDSTFDDIEAENYLIAVQLPANVPLADYRIVMQTTLLWYDEGTNTVTSRNDAATLTTPSVVTVKDDIKVLKVSRGMEILIICLCCTYGILAMGTFVLVLKYRQHPAIQLAQGTFLSVLALASAIGGICTFTFLEESDVFCTMRLPTVSFALNLIGAILVARLWRVSVTLSGAMQIGAQQGKASIRSSLHQTSTNCLDLLVKVLSHIARAKFSKAVKCFKCNRCSKETSHQHSSNFRTTANAAESSQLVTFLIFPQLVIIVVTNAIDPPLSELIIDESENVGQYQCERDFEWVRTVSAAFTAINYCLAVILAWKGKELPSFFNETGAIFNSAWVLLITLFVNVVVQTTSDNGGVDPNLSVFVNVISALISFSFLIYIIVLPKLWRAIRNEKIVLGDILRMNEKKEVHLYQDPETGPTPPPPTYMAGAPIMQQKDDPIPRNIEEQIFKLRNFLGRIVDQCGSGRALSARQVCFKLP